jgi:hypothetical protein
MNDITDLKLSIDSYQLELNKLRASEGKIPEYDGKMGLLQSELDRNDI